MFLKISMLVESTNVSVVRPAVSWRRLLKKHGEKKGDRRHVRGEKLSVYLAAIIEPVMEIFPIRLSCVIIQIEIGKDSVVVLVECKSAQLFRASDTVEPIYDVS